MVTLCDSMKDNAKQHNDAYDHTGAPDAPKLKEASFNSANMHLRCPMLFVDQLYDSAGEVLSVYRICGKYMGHKYTFCDRHKDTNYAKDMMSMWKKNGYIGPDGKLIPKLSTTPPATTTTTTTTTTVTP